MNSSEKVKECIRKYFNSGLYLRVGQIKLFTLIPKKDWYSQDAVDKVVHEEMSRLTAEGFAFSFRVNTDIIDRRDLYSHLHLENNLEKLQLVEHYLSEQFGVIDKRANLGAYFNELKNFYYDLVIDDENGMTLDQVYIDPTFAVIRSSIKKHYKIAPEAHDQKFFLLKPEYKIHDFVEDIFRGENVLKLDVMQGLVLILGYPGQGKSSLCKKIMNNYISKGKTREKLIFYFPLRNVRQAKNFIFNPLGVLYEEACENAEQQLDKFQFNKSLLILDGLDELYMRDNLKTEDIDKLCIELVRLLEKYADLRIILTSRYGYVDDERLTKDRINIIQMTPFSLKMQTEWLTKYQRFHPETWLTQNYLQYFLRQDEYKHIRELIEQPLLLHMIASVRNKIDQNTNRSRLYDQLFTELIDRRYARQGQLELLKNVDKQDLRSLIREVAFAIFKTGNEYITRMELLSLDAVKSFLELLPEENFRTSLKGVMISFYFKEIAKEKGGHYDEDKSDYAIEFLHKSLREYMTAEKVVFTLKEKFLELKMSGKYVLDDAESALKIINDLFGGHFLSEEVQSHLREIVLNDSSFDRKELVDRLLFFCPII